MVKLAYEIARKKLFFCQEDYYVTDVADLLQKNNIGSILVKNKADKVTGVITVGDVLRLIVKKRDPHRIKARDIMSSPVISMDKDSTIDELVKKFRAHKVTRMLLINSKGEYVGVVRDIAAFKYLTFVKFNHEAKERFGNTYFNRLY